MNDNAGMEADLLRHFPLALQWDKRMQAMAQVIAKALALRWQEAQAGSIYPNIESLPERVLDILAYDFKVDWWDPNYTLEEKRQVFKDSWYVHRHMGTKAAVETALKAVYRDAAVLEWFEYGGKPGYFRLWTDVTNEDFVPALRREILRRMDYYKRLSAHLESAGYYMRAEPARAYAYLAYGGQTQKRWGGIVQPPSVGPPETGAIVIYGGVLAGMTGAAERTVPVPPEVRPPVCRPSLVTAHFQFMNQIQRCWNGIVPPLSVGPPKAKVKAVYGGALAGMAGLAKREVKVPRNVGPPESGTRVVYGGVLAGMAGSLLLAGTSVELGI